MDKPKWTDGVMAAATVGILIAGIFQWCAMSGQLKEMRSGSADTRKLADSTLAASRAWVVVQGTGFEFQLGTWGELWAIPGVVMAAMRHFSSPVSLMNQLTQAIKAYQRIIRGSGVGTDLNLTAPRPTDKLNGPLSARPKQSHRSCGIAASGIYLTRSREWPKSPHQIR
jgi:hypothetical protein